MHAHIIDLSGAYIRTETLDPLGPQPAGAVYDELPEAQPGRIRMWQSGAWVQMLISDIPVPPELVPETPPEVTMAQCRLALYDLHGIPIENDDEFYALADVLPEENRVRARFELRTRATVRYDNILVIAICATKGWDRDELFIYGAQQ